MSMNWTQYLLGKLAEEAVEVAKEALKNQQQGVDSPWKGKPAIYEVRKEMLEMVAIAQLLDQQSDVANALGALKYLSPIPSIDSVKDDEIVRIIKNKIDRICYYALFSYKSGNLVLTRQQYDEVFAAGIRWGANNDGPYPHGCEFKG